MLIASWNVNGIRAAIRNGGFKTCMKTVAPDILCLQEIKARPEQVKPDLKGYLEYWNPADKPGYAGTAIFSREKPACVLYDIPPVIEESFALADDPFGNPNREGRVIAAEFGWGWVVSVYAPNSKRELSRLAQRCDAWEPAFLTFIRALEAGRFGTCAPKPVVFCGDLNVAHREIDLARPRENRRTHGFTDEERQQFQAIVDAGFVDSFRHVHGDLEGHYTWWSFGARERNIGWRIDYSVVSDTLGASLTGARIHGDIVGSDHVPVSIELTL